MSAQPHIRCVRTSGGLQGASWYDQDRLERFPLGTDLDVTIQMRRSGPRHRYYFALLGEVLPNLPEGNRFPRVEELHDSIKMELGYRKPILKPDGAIEFEPGSIAYDRMEDPDFRVFLDLALTLIQTHLIPGLDISLLKKEATRKLGRTFERVA